MTRHYSTSEAAQLLKPCVSHSTIRTMLKRNQKELFPGAYKQKGGWQIPLIDIERLNKMRESSLQVKNSGRRK